MLEATQISKMSMAERLAAMEQLWEALGREEAQVSSPGWHDAVLAERKALAETGKAHFLSLDQLRARLRAVSS